MTSAVIQLEDIIARAARQVILHVPDFVVSTGETIALIGPNGAGKSTLLHLAALLRAPDAGVVKVGETIATPKNAAALRRSISLVFQEPILFDASVMTNAASGLRFQGATRAEAERRAALWLERFGVQMLADRKARSLSGGEASRVALARAFSTDPAVLLLDEPFSALDAPTRFSLLPSLRACLHDTNAAAVLVTHDLNEAFAFADRVAVMEMGRIAAFGDAQELIARPPTRRVAELLGIETILQARIAGIDGSEARLETDGATGPSLRVKIPPGASLLVGDFVTVTIPAGATRAFRPGSDVPNGANALPGRIAGVIARPSGAQLVVETPAPIEALAAWDSREPRWAIGDCAIVSFLPETAHILPESS